MFTEIASFALLAVFHPVRGIPAAAVGVEQQERGLLSPDSGVIHPYLGYVIPPRPIAQSDFNTLEAYGFGPNSGPLIRNADPDTVVVAVVGGSVAKQFVESGGSNTLVTRLQQSPAFAGKRFVVTAPTNYGYKQPQQLLAIAYLLSQGAHFDMIINIDGFNEVAMSTSNALGGVNAEYPWMWRWRVQPLDAEPSVRLSIGELALMRRDLNNALRQARQHWSATVRLLSSVRARIVATQLAKKEAEFPAARAAQLQTSFMVQGPLVATTETAAIVLHAAQQWRQNADQLAALAEGNNIALYHFLQPNQYDIGSKPMDDAERAKVYDHTIYFRPGAELGYPMLRKEKDAMTLGKKHFTDLSLLFQNTEEDTYIDTCCHLNIYANNVMAEAIAAAILSRHE